MMRYVWHYILLLGLALLFLNTKVYSQSSDLGSWNIVNVKYTHSPKLSFFVESQIRSLKFFDHFHYYEYKGGINYKAGKALSMTIGAGSYQTFKEGGDFILPKNNDEFRLWPQIVLYQSVGDFKIEQRYRTELRWTSYGYRNRFRYRCGISYPLEKVAYILKPLQVSASNELFFTDKEPYFERNRLLINIHYKFSNIYTFQLGYLHQFDYKINDEIGRDFLTIGFFYDIFNKTNLM